MRLLIALLIFSVIIIIHEFGHFLFAKMNGITVVEFSLGMGPRLLSHEWGGTRYSLKILPFGGSCMMLGEDAEDEGEGTFGSKSVWARISVVVAGPIFNFILAFVLSIFIIGTIGYDEPIIRGVMDGYPAQEAGMQPGDLITRMNGERIYVAREIWLNTYVGAGETMNIEFLRDGEKHTVTLTPKYNEEEGRYLLGFNGYGEYVDCRNAGIFKYSYYEVRYSLRATIKSLGMLIQGKATKDDISGPIGVAQVIGEVREQAEPYGIWVVILNMINIALLLSVNLGVMNLLPLPALDGGRLVFLIIEAIRGKPVPPEKEGMVHFAGFVVLMILMVFVMFNDISRFFR